MPKGSNNDNDQEKSNSYKTSNVTLSDDSRDRLGKSVEKRIAKEKESVSKWERFKAVITNKDVKTTVKNVGKGYKAIGDAVSKTGDPDKLSSSAQSFGQSGTVIGGVTQLFETGVDVYLAKQKVDKAKRDLSTVEVGELQKVKEQSLEVLIAGKAGETDRAKKALTISESILAAQNSRITKAREDVTQREKDVERIGGQLRALEENLKPIPPNPNSIGGTGFLQTVQQRLVKELRIADVDLARLEIDLQIQTLPLRQEIEKIEGKLRALDENIQDAPEVDTGTDFYKEQQAKLNEDLTKTKTALAKVEEEMGKPITAKQQDIAKIEGKLRDVDDNIRAQSPEPTRLTGADFFMEQRDKLKKDLSQAKTDVPKLQAKVRGLESEKEKIEERVEVRRENYEKSKEVLTDLRTELAESLSTDKLKQRMAQKDLDTYNDSVPLERAKLMKSLLDGESALAGITSVATSGVSTVVSEGAKLSGGVVGVVVGPLTAVVNGIDLAKDHEDRLKALSLKHKASDALARKDGIKQDDAELLSIAERLRLKQKKTSVDKGLSGTKNFFGLLGGVGTTAAGAATIAGIVGAGVAGVAVAASILTPVGWALAGAAAAAAVGYGVYKLVRHLNSQAIKEALRETISITNKEDGGKTLSELKEENALSKKQIKALDKVAEKCLKAMKQENPDLDIKKGDLTVDQLNAYACKKLLARDTGVATEALLERFKAEVKAHLGDQPITKEAMEQYLKAEAQKVPVDSAVGLMAKLGVGLKAEEAVELYRDKSKNQSDGLKFLSKKIYSATKEEKAFQEKNLSQGVDGVKVEKGKSVEKDLTSSRDNPVLVSSRDGQLDMSRDGSSSSIQRDDQSGVKRERGSSVREDLGGEKEKRGSRVKLDDSQEVGVDGSSKGPKTRESFSSSKSEKVDGERQVLQRTTSKTRV
jgi:hypothetical protein